MDSSGGLSRGSSSSSTSSASTAASTHTCDGIGRATSSGSTDSSSTTSTTTAANTIRTSARQRQQARAAHEAATSHAEEKQAEGEGEAEEEETERSVGILFLAHDGVTNPTLWEKWRDSDPRFAHRIRFFVFRNTKLRHPSDFADRHDLGVRLRTKWCSSSIVKATVESLQVVLLRDAGVGMLYVVSGFDIPIQPPWALFTTRSVVTEGVAKTVVPFRTVLAWTPGDDQPFQDRPGWGKRNDDVRARVATHIQWCGLSREHAQRIVAYPDLGRLLKLGNKMSAACCPDEWILGTILTLQQQPNGAAAAAPTPAALPSPPSPPIIDWAVTDQYRSRAKDQSPVVWKDLDSTEHKVLWAPPRTYRTYTLATVVETVSRGEGNLFFRKVGPLTEEEIDRLVPHKKAKEEAAAAAVVETAVPAAASPVTHVPKKDEGEEEEEEDGEEGNEDKSPVVPSTPTIKRVGGGHRVRDRWGRRGCPEGGDGRGCCEECG